MYLLKLFVSILLTGKNDISFAIALNLHPSINSFKPIENMVRRKSLRRTFVTSTVSLCIVMAVANTTNIFAQNTADTAKKILLASANLKKAPVYIVKQSNVIFPEILKGNEVLASDYITSFSNKKRDYLVHMYTKGKKILPKISTILKKYNLPEELRILMILESDCNANAVSKAGAVGYWQIMDEVAKDYGLKYVQQMSAVEKKKLTRLNAKKAATLFKTMAKQKDDRKDFNTSTMAAARYLRDRRQNLDNNWLLIVASYNCGIGNVWHAIKKTGKPNPDFWDIKKFLPKETQNYVMNFIALNVIFNNYDNFVTNNLNFAPVKILIPDNFEQYMTEELGEPDGMLR